MQNSPPEATGAATLSAASVWQTDPSIVSQQRRVVRLLIGAQVLGSFGMGASASIGVLLVQQVIANEALAGLARTSLTLGAALFGVPLAMIAARHGRRVSLGLGWFLGALGAATLIASAVTTNVALVIGGMSLFGAGIAAGLQTRFSATDLALPSRRGRTLALVVWTGTFGSVVGPNLGVPGVAVAEFLGIPGLAGAFVIAAVMLLVASAVLFIGLRPDPLLTAQRHQRIANGEAPGTPRPRAPLRDTFRAIWGNKVARFAFFSVVLSHVMMVSLMTMTPVHMHHQGADLSVIGLTISVHVLGMFAFAPVVGWASDRFGPVPIILLGQVIFAASAVVAILVGYSWYSMAVSLFLLGLGWSCGTVPGSVLLSSSVPPAIRTQSQGTVDTTMNLVAAFAALFAGPIFGLLGYLGLAVAVLLVAVLAVTVSAWLPNGMRPFTRVG